MRASEILDLGRRAGLAPGVRALDLCCGVAGPGRYLTRELGCDYLGVDYSASALEIARSLSRDLPCRFEEMRIPPLPLGSFEVVLLLETILAFEDKAGLLAEVAGVLQPGGRFAFTLEEGVALSAGERETMPDADTVWLTPLAEIEELLSIAGMRLVWSEDCSRSHLGVVEALLAAFSGDGEIALQIGEQALAELLAAHRLWRDWLASGRIRKFMLLAEKR
ncbi:MAG: class I SAM-dependent methyltransferase [Candidatus Eremiobacteraeota bacterium]|nr:class I SAM-dependent methyltransferase [Candidatus Eremiobacteraeota bacterium]